MGFLGAILGKAADVATGLISSAFQHKNNQALMNDQYNMNRDMYGNRYQMTVSDLRAAGLNPILAAKGGLTGSSPSVGIPQAGMPNLGDSFGSTAKAFQDVEESKAKTEKTKQDTKVAIQMEHNEFRRKWQIIANTQESRQREKVAKAQEILIIKQTKTEMVKFEQIARQAVVLEREYDLLIKKEDREQADIYRIDQLTKEIKQRQRMLRLQADSIKSQLAKLRKTAQVYDGPSGALLAQIEAVMKAWNIHLGVLFQPGKE